MIRIIDPRQQGWRLSWLDDLFATVPLIPPEPLPPPIPVPEAREVPWSLYAAEAGA
jgi:hypothetical protein